MRLSIKGSLIGIVCGALFGLLFCWATAERLPEGNVGAAQEPWRVAAGAGILAVLGGVAGGILRASGWAMFAGGVLGALVTGAFGVVSTMHLKGLVYAPIGVPVGAVLVYLYGVNHEGAKPSGNASTLPGSVGVWDNDLDR
jgi:hypothetical protein